MYAPVILYPYRLDVLKERGYLRPPGAAKPDPIDAQWAARDKVQDARNDMRETLYVFIRQNAYLRSLWDLSG